MPSVSAIYGKRPISDAQRRRLFAIALGTQASVGALAGNKREKLMQLWEMIQTFGYDDWSCVEDDADPSGWITVDDYEELVSQLLAIKGESL